ncbi:hypothetical protein BDM02DRAFT_3193624 [Thelephora ganbajun]|uniref:Uncharacterized protein n=1 Tax=Thelephora ganbajun TaxID=370292 RepID=A0ACB6YY99_THEGA|nr:hypothetical protein BDM02DRAFT_3193624 [Thelephora ganbajun]
MSESSNTKMMETIQEETTIPGELGRDIMHKEDRQEQEGLVNHHGVTLVHLRKAIAVSLHALVLQFRSIRNPAESHARVTNSPALFITL